MLRRMANSDNPYAAKRSLLALSAAILGLVILTLGFAWDVENVSSARNEAIRWEKHTREVLLQTAQMFSQLQDLETGQRGYVVTGRLEYLEPYVAGRAHLDEDLDRLTALTADNPAQQARITEPRQIVAGKIAELAETIALIGAGDGQAALGIIATSRGKLLMDKARAIVEAIYREENRLLDIRSGNVVSATQQSRWLTISLATSGLAAICSAIMATFIAVRSESARARALARVYADLRESEGKYRLLADNSTDMIIVVDRQLICRYVSPSSRELLGYEPEELVAGSVDRSLHPEDVARVMAAAQELFASRDHDRDRITYRLRHRDDHWVWVESLRKVLYSTDTGAPTGLCSTLRDISKRVAAEAAMHESEERYRLLMQSGGVTQAIYMLDPDGNVENWNAGAERIKGYTSAEIIGRNFSTLFTPEDVGRGEPARILASARNHGQFSATGWRVRKDGTRFWARVALDAIRKDDGTLRGFAKVTHDITSQRIEEEQRAIISDAQIALRESNERYRMLLQSSVTEALYMLDADGNIESWNASAERIKGYTSTEIIGRHFSTFFTSEDRAIGEPARMLAMARDSGHFTIEGWRIPAAVAKGLGLVLTATTPLRLVVDPTRLRQVLINLLGNAIKFTSSGLIELRLQKMEGGVSIRLEVADTGPGIQAQHRDRLFQTFERVNAEAVSGIEGSGVGLALAARLTRLMGGRIGYDDNSGGGSVFWLELPVGSVDQLPAKIAATAPAAGSRSLRVLVVDDEALNRNIATGVLRFGGHEGVCVDNGAAAIAAAAIEDFDVILMDVRMPGMNGLEATRRIRALPAPHGIVPVVAVTAQAFAEQIEICRQAGMDSHVSKPFTKAVLLAAVEKAATTPNAARPRGAELPKTDYPAFDRTIFATITDHQSASEIAEDMQDLVTRCEVLLHGLRDPGMPTRAGELVEDVHSLSDTAGTFGFLNLAYVARRFERAAGSGTTESAALATHLVTAAEATVAILRRELAGAAEFAA